MAHPTSAHRPAHLPAFTLIELLVVISVIALLIGILLPVLSSARRALIRVRCLSNIRQIGLATQLYTVDHKGQLPYESRGDEAAGFRCWVDVLYEDSYLARVDASDGVLICPSVDGVDPASMESYRMNSKLAETTAGQPGFRPHQKLSAVPEPTRTVGYFDADTGGGVLSFKGRWRDSGDDVNYRHSKAASLVFLDWHAELIPKKDLSQRSFGNDDVVWQLPSLGPWAP